MKSRNLRKQKQIMDKRSSPSFSSPPSSSSVSFGTSYTQQNPQRKPHSGDNYVSSLCQVEQKRQYCSNIGDDVADHDILKGNKRQRTESENEVHVYNVYPNVRNSPSNLKGARGALLPNVWRSVNSSHYIFDDEDSGNESKIRGTDFSPRDFTSLNGKRNSQLWRRSDVKLMSQKGRNSPDSQTSQTQSSGIGKYSLSCLTSCRSCKEYSLPDISVEVSSEISHYVALDCEFVGVGPKGRSSSLGRCSIVNHRGDVLFDRFVKPPQPVTDYRTPWSGLRPRNIRRGIPLVAAQEMIRAIIKDKVVIGHAVHNDFRVMGFEHPFHMIRDTAGCKMLREMADLSGNACALKKLTFALLGRTIQKKEHCSVTDARACLDLFRLVRTKWEPILQAKFQKRLARRSSDEDKASDSVDVSRTGPDPDPNLSSFLEDQYWPENMFTDLDTHHV